jgi:TonB family protein
MRNLVVSLMLAVSFACTLAGQQQADTSDATPTPDAHGVYDLDPGVLQPMFVDRAPVELPASAPDAGKRRCFVRVVIGADGALQSAEVAQSAGADIDNALLEAIRHSRFSAGLFNGNPVPVRIFVTARTLADGRTVPRILTHTPEAVQLGEDQNYDVPPKAVHWEEARFSDEALKKRIEGAVIISVLVGKDGMPSDLKIVRGLGYGLDENALAAVARYRFQPATKNGVPVATRIPVEISFRLR